MQVSLLNSSLTQVKFGSTDPFENLRNTVVQDLQLYIQNHQSLTEEERHQVLIEPDETKPSRNKVRVTLLIKDWGNMDLLDKVSQILQQNPKLNSVSSQQTKTPDTFMQGSTTVQIILASQDQMQSSAPKPIRQTKPIVS